MRARWSSLASGRVNPLAPVLVAVAGVILILVGYTWIGSGVVMGAALALINGILLSHRVDFAADTGNIVGALMVMQLGLLVTFTIIGVAIVIIVHFSVPMAVATAAGFAITQLAMLALFYLKDGRASVAERKAEG